MIIKLSKENREQLEPLLKFPTLVSPTTGDIISAPPTLEEAPQIILQFIKLIGAHIDEGGFLPAPTDIVGLQILFETLTARIRLVRNGKGDQPYESNWKL